MSGGKTVRIAFQKILPLRCNKGNTTTAHGQHTTHLMGSFPLQGVHPDCCAMHKHTTNRMAIRESHQEQAKLKTIRKVKRQRHGTHAANTLQRYGKDTAKTRQHAANKYTANARQNHGTAKPMQNHGKDTAKPRQSHGKDTAKPRHGKTNAKPLEKQLQNPIKSKTRQNHGKDTAKTRQNNNNGTAKTRQNTAKTRQQHGKDTAKARKKTRQRQRHGKDTATVR